MNENVRLSKILEIERSFLNENLPLFENLRDLKRITKKTYQGSFQNYLNTRGVIYVKN